MADCTLALLNIIPFHQSSLHFRIENLANLTVIRMKFYRGCKAFMVKRTSFEDER